jgi:hypothetical protein
VLGGLVVLAAEPEHAVMTIRWQRQAGQGERGVRAEQAGRAEGGAGCAQAPAVAEQQSQVRVAVEHAPGPVQVGAVAEMHGLGELDDPVIGKGGDDPLAEPLVVRPQIAEVPAAVQQDGSGRQEPGQVFLREGAKVAHIRQVSTEVPQQLPFAEPDRAVADVRVPGEIDQGAAGAALDQSAQDLAERAPDARQIRFVVHGSSGQGWSGG